MSQSTLLLVLSGLAARTVLLAGLVVYVELRRMLALDRRLSLPRRHTLAMGLRPQRRRRAPGIRGEARAFGRALVTAGSLLVPIGAAEREKLARSLRQAGFAHSDSLSLFLSLKLGAALAFGAVVALTGLVVGPVIGSIVARSTCCERWPCGAPATCRPPCPTRSI